MQNNDDFLKRLNRIEGKKTTGPSAANLRAQKPREEKYYTHESRKHQGASPKKIFFRLLFMFMIVVFGFRIGMSVLADMDYELRRDELAQGNATQKFVALFMTIGMVADPVLVPALGLVHGTEPEMAGEDGEPTEAPQ